MQSPTGACTLNCRVNVSGSRNFFSVTSIHSSPLVTTLGYTKFWELLSQSTKQDSKKWDVLSCSLMQVCKLIFQRYCKILGVVLSNGKYPSSVANQNFHC